MEVLSEFEHAVLIKLFAGDHPVLVTLREQVKSALVTSREYTGAGFFCSFEVPSGVPLVTTKGDFHFGDVNAAIAGLEYGAGFAVFIRDGRLETLEGYSYEEPWPKEIGDFSLTYQCEPRDLQLPGALFVSDKVLSGQSG